MGKKGGNFFEEHIEKIALAIVGVVCVWLLVTRFLFSPNVVSYDNKKFGPGDIDDYIREQAEHLKNKLDGQLKPQQAYKPRVDDFTALIDGKRTSGSSIYAKCYPLTAKRYPLTANYAIGDIDVGLYLPLPNNSTREVSVKRIYSVPRIGEVSDVAIEHIRAVAYVPTEKIDERNSYDKVKHKQSDLDFVTVEARFDVASLENDFYESFASEYIQEEWRDPCLAKPIFAAVQLQRQELLADDSWSDWQIVPRAKIDNQKKLFEVIEDVEKLPAGRMKVRMLQFDDARVRMDLLQPEAYRIASAKEEWFPPSLHKEYLENQKEIALEEKRKAREAEEEKRKREREKAIAKQRGKTTGTRGRTGAARVNESEMISRMFGGAEAGMPSMPRTPTRQVSPRTRRSPRDRRSQRGRPARGRERERVVQESKQTEETKGQKFHIVRKGESISEIAKKYYGSAEEWQRILEANRKDIKDVNRLIPGTKLVIPEAPKTASTSDFYKKLDKILITEKTDFAKMSEPLVFWAHDDTVEPEKSFRYRIRLGVFNPIAGTEQFSEEDKSQKNNVILWSKFSAVTAPVEIPGMLYFFPRQVQDAAKIVTVQVSKYMLGYWYSKNFMVKPGEIIGKAVERALVEEKKGTTVPKTVDYTTGAVLVAVEEVNDWSGGKNLHKRYYSDMLYSFDGANIYHMPIEPRYWAAGLQSKFNEIAKSEEEPREPLRAWGGRVSGGRVSGGRRGAKPAGKAASSEEELIKRMFEGMFSQ